MKNVRPLQAYFLKNGNAAIIIGDSSTFDLKLFVIEKSSFEHLDHNSPEKIVDELRRELND